MAHLSSHTCRRQSAELLDLLEAEARLQRQLKAQCELLQRISEASVSLFVWWRDGAERAAATSASATPLSPLATDTAALAAPRLTRSHPVRASLRQRLINGSTAGPPQHPLHFYRGMCFYSLGELLGLAVVPIPGNTPVSQVDGAVSGGGGSNERGALQDDAAEAMGTAPWTMTTAALQAAAQVQLPTPGLLIRHRLLDPSSSALPPAHPLLLGSLNSTDFPRYLAWLRSLLLECDEAVRRLRPDKRPCVGPFREAEGINASGGSPISHLQTQQRSESEEAMWRAVSEEDTLMLNNAVGEGRGSRRNSRMPDKRVRAVTDEGVALPRAGNTEPWDALAWSSLCASLFRLLAFVMQVTEMWGDCWAACTAPRQSRAQCRFFRAGLGEVLSMLREVCVWYTTWEAPCEDSPFRARRQKVEQCPSPPLSPSRTQATVPRTPLLVPTDTHVTDASHTGMGEAVDATAVVALREVQKLEKLCGVVYQRLGELLPDPKL